MLSVKKLNVSYGMVKTLFDIEMEVRQGEVVALIGSNGAGKTTTLKAITGLVPVSGGKVVFEGVDITGQPPHATMKMGLVHVPQGRQVFADQTVEDNLILGAYTHVRKEKGRVKDLIQREYNRFPVLAERRKQLAGTLSGGEQQMLAISRGLMSEPRFIALDEPSLGLAPLLVKGIMKIIVDIHNEGGTVLLVEQMATAALAITDRGYVLQTGRIKLSGTSSALLNDPEVRKTYLGERSI